MSRTCSSPLYFSDFWHHCPIPLADVARSGVIQSVNAAWTTLLGYSRAELEGKHFREITHPADFKGDNDEVTRLLTDPEADGYAVEKRYISKRGNTVWVGLYVRAIRNESGEVEYFAVCAIPLPNQSNDSKESAAKSSLLRVVALGLLALVKERTRECIIALVLVLVATGRISIQAVTDAIKAYFER